MENFAANQILRCKRRAKRGEKLAILKPVFSCSMRIGSDARTNYISAKNYIASPSVAKMCGFHCHSTMTRVGGKTAISPIHESEAKKKLALASLA